MKLPHHSLCSFPTAGKQMSVVERALLQHKWW